MAIGIPGSGKTTELEPLARKHGFTYIRRDAIREEIYGDPLVQHDKTPIWEEERKRFTEAFADNKSVVLDATFVEKHKGRADVVRGLREAGAERVIGILFDVPLEIAAEQNRMRPYQVRPEVIKEMYDELHKHPPTTEEGFDAIIPASHMEEVEQIFAGT